MSGLVVAVVLLVIGPAAVASAAANPWMTPADQFVNFAHQGGELEAPGNTMFAFKTAMRESGADGIEMDAYISADGQLVVIHDRTLQGTTNSQQPGAPAPFGPGQPDEVWDYTVAELKTLDDAYWFAPGTGQYNHSLPTGDYIFRGVADGDIPPPPGYAASDFRIPTFQEVLDEFPDTRIDIEIKSQSGHIDKGEEAARELAAILAAQPGGDDENVLVSSFGQAELEAFHEALPQHDSLSASLSSTSDYALGGVPIQPAPQALQPPDIYDLGGGLLIDAPAFLKPFATTDGYALHVWGSDAEPEGDNLYQHMLDVGVQGFFAQKPALLSTFLCSKGIPRPDGSSHCTPNPDMPGIRPILKLTNAQTTKATVESGEKVVVEFGIENTGNLDLTGAEACATATGRAARWVKPGRCGKPGLIAPGTTLTARIPIRAKRKAKGVYDVSIAVASTDGGSAESELTLRVRNKKKHRGD